MENGDLGPLEFTIQVIGLLIFLQSISRPPKPQVFILKAFCWYQFSAVSTFLMSKENPYHNYDKKSRKTSPSRKSSRKYLFTLTLKKLEDDLIKGAKQLVQNVLSGQSRKVWNDPETGSCKQVFSS